MPRRSKSNSNKKTQLATYAGAFVLTIIILAAGKSYLSKQAKHFASLNDISISDLQESGNSLSGNEYRIKGKISERIILSDQRGLLVSIKPNDQRASGTVPVHIPPGIDRINIERGHSYTFKVEVNREGLPVAKEIQAE